MDGTTLKVAPDSEQSPLLIAANISNSGRILFLCDVDLGLSELGIEGIS
jgi:hypothetical protein